MPKQHSVGEGDEAPDFTLAGVHEGEKSSYSLREELEAGNRVLLLFYPADFSPICTAELCSIRNAEWFQVRENLSVWAVSGDSTYSHQAFADEYALNFPLLTDHNGDISERYGVRYDEWEGNSHVPKRAVFLIDIDGVVRYVWQTEDAYVEPDFSPVLDAVHTLSTAADAPDAMPEYDRAEIERL